MRGYVPLGWSELATLHVSGALAGPTRACVVDPAWRLGDPEVDEEVWESEAQTQAAEQLPEGVGVVLAVDVSAPAGITPEDGWLTLPDGIRRRDLAAVLTAELAWYAVQEIPALLAERSDADPQPAN